MSVPNHSHEEEARLAQEEKLDFLRSAFFTKSFDTHLRYEPFRDYDYVYLVEPLSWQWETHHEWEFPGISGVEAVTNFVTDLTSVPRIFWSLIPRHGPYAYGAIVHDYLYWHQSYNGVPLDRETADRIFKLAMDDMNVSSLNTGAIYNAVRWFGGWAWKRNQQLRQSGEKRLLARTPGRPDISWKEWKSDPSNLGDWWSYCQIWCPSAPHAAA